jgi:predicted ArsR family transcriptional regulator
VVKIPATTDRAAECRTRDGVARLLLEQGPATAASLGARLGLSPAAVRRHLEALAADGLVEIRHQRPLGPRGRGRPAKLFTLTESGRESFPHAYDDLAAAALRYLAEVYGPDAVTAFAESRLAPLEERNREAVATAGDAPQRLQALARVLSEEGYAATVGPPPQVPAMDPAAPPAPSAPPAPAAPPTAPAALIPAPAGPAAAAPTGPPAPAAVGDQLCQHHCPVAHVAAEFPQLCEAETRVFARMLGTHVQRLATIARGDGICTTHVPAARRRRATAPGTTPTPVTGRTSR